MLYISFLKVFFFFSTNNITSFKCYVSSIIYVCGYFFFHHMFLVVVLFVCFFCFFLGGEKKCQTLSCLQMASGRKDRKRISAELSLCPPDNAVG